MAISNPLNGLRKGGTVGKPFPGVQVSKEFQSQNDNMFLLSLVIWSLTIIFIVGNRSRFLQMTIVMRALVSFVSKALQCLRNTGNVLRYLYILF